MDNYNRESSQDDKGWVAEGFTLCFRRETSKKKPFFQALKVGLIALKIQSFLCFQIFQQERMTTSVKQGPMKCRLANFNISGPEPMPQEI
jgi:hypothetical protein